MLFYLKKDLVEVRKFENSVAYFFMRDTSDMIKSWQFLFPLIWDVEMKLEHFYLLCAVACESWLSFGGRGFLTNSVRRKWGLATWSDGFRTSGGSSLEIGLSSPSKKDESLKSCFTDIFVSKIKLKLLGVSLSSGSLQFGVARGSQSFGLGAIDVEPPVADEVFLVEDGSVGAKERVLGKITLEVSCANVEGLAFSLWVSIVA